MFGSILRGVSADKFAFNRGYTLIEVLFSLSLFSISITALFPAFLDHIRFNTFSEVRSSAYQAAQSVLDDLRLQDPSTLPSSGSTSPVEVVVGDRTFQVVPSYCEDLSLCGSTTRHMTIRVSRNSEELYEVETVFTQLE